MTIKIMYLINDGKYTGILFGYLIGASSYVM